MAFNLGAAATVTSLRTITSSILANTTAFNAFVDAGSPTVPVKYVVTVESGIEIGATTSFGLSMKNFPKTPVPSILEIVVKGSIRARGGDGGNGRGPGPGFAGERGGDAIVGDSNIKITVDPGGAIRAGGGGGGGGGGEFSDPNEGAGGGGGGGQGDDATGAAGNGAVGSCGTADNGTVGSEGAAGTGGAGKTCGPAVGGAGGNGGAYAVAGLAGGAGGGNPGGSGGNAGKAVNLTSGTTDLTDNGTVIGVVD